MKADAVAGSRPSLGLRIDHFLFVLIDEEYYAVHTCVRQEFVVAEGRKELFNPSLGSILDPPLTGSASPPSTPAENEARKIFR